MSKRADGLARASFIALGFSIPISAAADGLLTAAIVISWLLAARFRETALTIRENPVAAAACIWFAAHVLGALYSIGDAADIARVVSKAATFLLVPIAATLLVDARDREWALRALMAAIALTAVLSTLRWLEVIPADAPLLRSTANSPTVVFKYHLTQNLLVALGAFLFAVKAREARTARIRSAWIAASCLAVMNVLVMGDGRIGQVVLVLLLVYFAVSFRNVRVIAAAAALVSVVAGVVYVVPDNTLYNRSAKATAEAHAWNSGARVPGYSSIGQRLDFYQRSIRIVAKHPFLGVGTGGFPAAYEQEVAETTLKPTRNPHNEYLLRAVELGAVGVLLVLALFVTVWHQAPRLARRTDTLIARGLVITFACAGLASSPLADHTETLLFVWLVGILFAGYRSPRPATSRVPAPPGAASPGTSRSG